MNNDIEIEGFWTLGKGYIASILLMFIILTIS